MDDDQLNERNQQQHSLYISSNNPNIIVYPRPQMAEIHDDRHRKRIILKFKTSGGEVKEEIIDPDQGSREAAFGLPSESTISKCSAAHYKTTAASFLDDNGDSSPLVIEMLPCVRMVESRFKSSSPKNATRQKNDESRVRKIKQNKNLEGRTTVHVVDTVPLSRNKQRRTITRRQRRSVKEGGGCLSKLMTALTCAGFGLVVASSLLAVAYDVVELFY